ncbi:MAG: acyltransferase [Dehalococcoidia bacterium]|nr:acyltransferase [Dehalococcoidia bacterium]
MKALLFKLSKRIYQTRIPLSVTLIGVSNIHVGNNCWIDPLCYLKSEGPDGVLRIGNNVAVKRYSHISAKGSKVEIKDFSYVGYNNWIGGQGNITIGRNFMSGMNVVIISSNHDYYNINVPYHMGDEIKGDILIGANVWIGANSVVLPGTSIGDGAVIGAGSIVTQDIPQYVLVTGNPAMVIKQIHRKSGESAT